MRTGRPPVYTGNLKRHIVGLVNKHNASKAMRILRAQVGDPLAGERNLKLVPEPLSISMPTILGFAKEAGVTLRRGRPTKAA